jgi:hypothetical protein
VPEPALPPDDDEPEDGRVDPEELLGLLDELPELPELP